MSTWSTSDWLMFRPVLMLAFLSIVMVAAWAVIKIRKQWIAFHAKRRGSIRRLLPRTL
jgi:hypothetical protein